MDFQPPSELAPFEVLFDSSEPNSALPADLTRFVGSMGFPPPPAHRPWVFSNFVQTLDGLVSFGGTRPGGEWISQSLHDRWMMDLLRAHADALICGAQSLRLEAQFGRLAGGPVFRIVDDQLLRLRREVLRRGKLKNIIVAGSGNLRTSEYRLFRSEHVEAWVVTSPEGARQLGDVGKTKVLVSGKGRELDLPALLGTLRREHGVEYLLCEGGPRLYGSMARQGLIDEKFLTIAPQEIGQEIGSRPTTFPGPGLTAETARWYRWISSRRAGDHEFNRYRVLPPGEHILPRSLRSAD